jgi:hypothetical protein
MHRNDAAPISGWASSQWPVVLCSIEDVAFGGLKPGVFFLSLYTFAPPGIEAAALRGLKRIGYPS